ncbi:MAG: UDP-4-amino-4,6-dideoxy-N-acetyl-beta-L-altrosamine transaminase [Alphaproteobacteria bacterium]|jgi:UDP-4-amino-4,6-dideoxy-N-acetyl-beta-L-altrosamine transaminase|nr:UDP-4-amino-4,6-dideoxy-N-acetyl-beta-L-altrosamine transaminase [Alphaproteobacteria bacterium]
MKKPDPHSDQRFLPYGRQSVDEADIAAVVSVLRGDWLTTGPAVDAFETALCEATGAKHAVACSNGTAALHLALLAASIGPGDSVIVPANTFLATANAARLVGAEIVFADIDPKSGQMLAKHAEAAYARAGSQRVAGVMPVYFAGQCAAPHELASFASTHGLRVIEDACHALGTTYRTAEGNHQVGSADHADMTTFSFHPVKTITTAEGGAIATRDADLADRLRRFRNHGMTRDPAQLTNAKLAHAADGDVNPWYYEMAEPGLNYRVSDLQCALGTSQLKRLPAIVDIRRALVAHYAKKLAPLAPLVQPLEIVNGCSASWHLQVVRINFAAAGTTRAEVMNALREQGVGSQVHYIPVPWQPYYRDRYGDTDFPGASAYYDTCLSLPLFETLTMAEVDRVVDTLESVLSGPRH